MTTDSVPQLLDHLFRHSAGQMVAMLTRIFGPQYIDLAEDVVQETLIKALRHWTYGGVPENPSAWIFQVARNSALDAVRRERRLRDRQEVIAAELRRSQGDGMTAAEVLDHELRDDQLRMIFMCCHPAISREAQVALTLKTVGGFGVPEIARAFLAPEATIAQRLVRAKRTIRDRKIPFEAPDAGQLPGRLDVVLEVLYGLFNEGYSTSSGDDPIRHDLCAEAIRLAALLSNHPECDRPEVHALFALMLLQAARLPARIGAGGDLLLLEDQDRSLWNRAMIGAGIVELSRSASGNRLVPYHVEAGIAACHALAPSYAETHWQHILHDYDRLMALSPTPVVALNRIVALSMVQGSAVGLAELDSLGANGEMETYHLFQATRADLLRRLKRYAEAASAYRCAAALTSNPSEQRFLLRRLGECS